jgi:hypothetical protein
MVYRPMHRSFTEFWILWKSDGVIKSWQGPDMKHTLGFAISKSVFHIGKPAGKI